MSIKVLVLAGSRPGIDALAKSEGVSHKSLITVAGVSMLARVVTALRQSDASEVIVATQDEAVAREAERLGARCVEARESPSTTVQSVLQEVGLPLLVTTADHVFLEAGWVNHMIAATPQDQDLGIMLARRDQIEAAMPGTQRTYFRFADAQWSGCNLFYLAGDRAIEIVKLWQKVEKDRKQPWRIAAGIGLGTLFQLLLGRLGAQEAISRVAAKVGARATSITAPNGLAAIDVDKVEDLEQVRAYLLGEK